MPPRSRKPGQNAFLDQETPSPAKRNQRRWRMAFTAIYFTRVLVSLSKKVIDNQTRLLRSLSYVSINVNDDTPHQMLKSLVDIDQKALTEMVKNRNLESLHQLGGAKQVATILLSDAKEGISNDEADLTHRREVFGANKFQKPPAKGFFSFVLEALKDTTIIILLVCAILSLAFGIKQDGPKDGWYDGGSIIVAVILVIAVSSISNFKQSKQFDKLSEVSKDIKVQVVRNGRHHQISIFDIVVGDVVSLKIGDQIPADGLFLEGYSLKVDESSMTGESDHVEINANINPFMLSGTKVIDGFGSMLVTSVGMNTAWGEMMSSIINNLEEQTPLQARLDKLASYIGKVGLSVALLVLGVLMLRYFTGHTKDEFGNREYNGSKTKVNDLLNSVVGIIAAAVTILVVAIPEGLPLAVTLTLAYSMMQMIKDNAMVRKLSACETMGSATTILLGIVGLKDPCRPGVRTAVESCKNAGLNVKMITGDNMHTARSIALECGILNLEEDMDKAVVEGVQFRNFSPEERMARIDDIRVMARSSPFDKLLMVQCLKQKGNVVGVTGDGTNDAPALKEADIGLAMGIQGTEVAKESADIIILDDNFTSVVTVVRWGRCVYNNIQKFLQFQLTVNVAALVINFVAAVSSGKVPLTAVQLLWVNLIMDTLGALALATEQPTNDLMEKRPVGRSEPLITKIMWRNLMAQALYQVAILLTLEFKAKSIFGVNEKVKNTIIFNTFVLCQVFNEFNSRNMEKNNIFKGIHRNKLFLAIIGMTIVLQVLMVELLKRFASTERLNWGQWGACIGIAALSWPIACVAKCIPISAKQLQSK